MKPLKEILNRSRGPAVRRAGFLAGIQSRLRSCLPRELAENAFVAAFERGSLVVIVPSPTWATRLRFLQNEILDCMAQPGQPTPGRLDVRVDRTRSANTKKRGHPRSLSNASAATIVATAGFVNDPALAAALKRLARRRKAQ